MHTHEQLFAVAKELDHICRANGCDGGLLDALLLALTDDELEENIEFIANCYAASSINEILDVIGL